MFSGGSEERKSQSRRGWWIEETSYPFVDLANLCFQSVLLKCESGEQNALCSDIVG